jgi:predicted ATPase
VATFEEMATSDAVRLFDDRARRLQPDFALTPTTLPAVAAICRRLGGLPLAIELAAARVSMFSVEQLELRLNDPLQVLTAGSRTAGPRHQTLRATLD